MPGFTGHLMLIFAFTLQHNSVSSKNKVLDTVNVRFITNVKGFFKQPNQTEFNRDISVSTFL
jgi:hypothetical protein